MSTIAILAVSAALNGASPYAEPLRTEVPFERSDLATAHGQAALRERIHEAAESVCVLTDTRSLRLHAEHRACIERAVEAAEAQLREKIAEAGRVPLAQREADSAEG